MNPGSAAQQIIETCRGLGFAQVGICSVEPTRWRRQFIDWLRAGKHGSMSYLVDHLRVRLSPARLLEDGCALSAIMVADQYAERGACDDPPLARGRGRIARYARGRDYHRVMKKRLHALCDELRARHPGHRFRAFVDTAPVLERELAERAGLGWVGKHTLLIHDRLGSYFLLGGVMTTLELADSRDGSAGAGRRQRGAIDHCGTCTRCIDACPTGAITPYSVDAGRCISYLTIERRGPVDRRFHDAIGSGGHLFGCDICQEVCPHNSPARRGYTRASRDRVNPDYAPRPKDGDPPGTSLDLLAVLGWSEDDRRWEFRGSAMKRATLAMLKRNALIVAAAQLRAHPLPGLRARIQTIASDPREDPMVRETALAVAGELERRAPSGR